MGHGGWKKRICVSRSTVDTVGATHPQLEAPEVYFPLVDLDGATTTYDWDGSVSPNEHMPYRANHGRGILQLTPRPTERTEFRVRGLMRPRPLLHDQDTIELPPEGCNVLLDGLAAEVWKMIGNPQEADKFVRMYEKGLAGLNASYDPPAARTRIVRKPQQPSPGTRKPQFFTPS